MLNHKVRAMVVVGLILLVLSVFVGCSLTQIPDYNTVAVSDEPNTDKATKTQSGSDEQANKITENSNLQFPFDNRGNMVGSANELMNYLGWSNIIIASNGKESFFVSHSDNYKIYPFDADNNSKLGEMQLGHNSEPIFQTVNHLEDGLISISALFCDDDKLYIIGQKSEFVKESSDSNVYVQNLSTILKIITFDGKELAEFDFGEQNRFLSHISFSAKFGDYIYYAEYKDDITAYDSLCIKRVSVTNGFIEVIVPDSNNLFSVHDGYVYYNRYNGREEQSQAPIGQLCRVKIDGGEPEVLCERATWGGTIFDVMSVYDGYCYFFNFNDSGVGELSRIPCEGGAVETVIDNYNSAPVNIYDNRLFYYRNNSKGANMYVMNLSQDIGKELSQLYSVPVETDSQGVAFWIINGNIWCSFLNSEIERIGADRGATSEDSSVANVNYESIDKFLTFLVEKEGLMYDIPPLEFDANNYDITKLLQFIFVKCSWITDTDDIFIKEYRAMAHDMSDLMEYYFGIDVSQYIGKNISTQNGEIEYVHDSRTPYYSQTIEWGARGTYDTWAETENVIENGDGTLTIIASVYTSVNPDEWKDLNRKITAIVIPVGENYRLLSFKNND